MIIYTMKVTFLNCQIFMCVFFLFWNLKNVKVDLMVNVKMATLRGGSLYNENPFITLSTNALGFNAICQTKDQSVADIMVHETLSHLTKINKLQTFSKAPLITLHIFSSEL